MLVVRESNLAGAIRELRVQVEQTVLFVVERVTANVRRFVGADPSRTVEAESPFVLPLVVHPGSTSRVVHALPHHHFHLPLLQSQGENRRPVVPQQAFYSDVSLSHGCSESINRNRLYSFAMTSVPN